MTVSVKTDKVHVVKVHLEAEMIEHRACAEPNAILRTSTYHHPVSSRHVKLEPRIRTTQYS